jgi:hypothetical protein
VSPVTGDWSSRPSDHYGGATPSIHEFTVPQRSGAGVVYGGSFIAACAAGVPPLPSLAGDCRSGSDSAAADRYRAYFYIDFSTGKAYLRINPSCYAGGGCVSARPIENSDAEAGWFGSNRFSSSATNGSVNIHYSGLNSVEPAPAFNVSLTLHFGSDNAAQVSGIRTVFPSLAVYQNNGPVRQLVYEPEAAGGPGTLFFGPIQQFWGP